MTENAAVALLSLDAFPRCRVIPTPFVSANRHSQQTDIAGPGAGTRIKIAHAFRDRGPISQRPGSVPQVSLIPVLAGSDHSAIAGLLAAESAATWH